MITEIVVVVLGYLLGSIPSAYIMARVRKGIDIRNFDMGNVGGGNVLRAVGVWEGIVVILADAAKGAVAVLIAQALDVSQVWVLASGFAVLIGHSFPVFIGFRGGRGSASAMGILLVLAPKEMGIVFGIMAIPYLITRNNAFSIFIGFAFLPLLAWLLGEPTIMVLYLLAIIIFIGLRSLPIMRKAIADIRNKGRT